MKQWHRFALSITDTGAGNIPVIVCVVPWTRNQASPLSRKQPPSSDKRIDGVMRFRWQGWRGRRMCGLGWAAASLMGWSGSLRGQESTRTAVSETVARQETPSEIRVPALSRGLHVGDFERMALRPELRGQMAQIGGFVQSSPVDGSPATQKTEAYIGYTPLTLYVAFVCFDTSPRLIRAHLARRENILADDNVSVLLDPFQDRRRGILFSMNPMGVQADASWTDNNGADYSYDQVWDSEARMTDEGWVAVFAIPFRSLRFRPGATGWGVVLMRGVPRNSEGDNWPHISTNVTGTLSQEATLRGIAGTTGSHNLQLNPYALAQNEHALNSLDPLNPYFSSRSLEGTAGGEAKAILKDSIVVDATINPDFSQVESDQPQFTVNQRFPVYFPELRPFFLENASYFSTPINLVYTRNIVHPEFGVRVTGKVHKTNVGLLAIDDREPGETFGLRDPEYKKRALYAVGRVTQDLGKGSSIGAIYTDEEFAGSWNRIGGLDFMARLTEKWTAQGQMVESSSKALDGSYRAGPASYVEVTRQGHALNMDNTIRDYSTGFQSQVGFIQTTDFYQESNHINYQWYPKRSIFQSVGLESNQQVAFDHQKNRIYHYSEFDPFFLLPRNTTIAPLVGENSDTLGPQDGYSIQRNINFTENYVGFVVRSAPFRQLKINIVAQRSGNVNYNPAPGAPPSLLNQEFLQALVTLAASVVDVRQHVPSGSGS